jgi:hypothetical protein
MPNSYTNASQHHSKDVGKLKACAHGYGMPALRA